MYDRDALHVISGEFCDRAQEVRFRARQGPAELKQLRLLWSAALLCFLLYLPADLVAVPVAPGLLWGRGLIVAAGIIVLLLLLSPRWQRHRDGIASVGLCLAMVGYGVVLGERGESTGALLLLLLGSYLFSPGRFLLQAITGTVGSVLAAVIAGSALSGLDVSYLVPANLLALLALAQSNRNRRRLFLQGLRLSREIQQRKRAQQSLKKLHDQNLALLHNALPARIAGRLKREPKRSLATLVPDTTILFADLVGFTPLARSLTPAELLRLLNGIFSHFDALAERHHLEKIKTVGDAYLAMAGPRPSGGCGASDAARMALDLQRALAGIARTSGLSLGLRVGLHRGPVVAGVIGRKRLAYDIWGDVVNVACRLQSAAPPGGILVSAATRRGCAGSFRFGRERQMTLRGCGEVSASLLYPTAASSRSSSAAISSAEATEPSTVKSAKRS